MSFLNKIAYWLVGADMYIVNQNTTSEKDKRMLVLTGWFIALASIVSTVVATIFVTMFFEDPTYKTVFGVLTAIFWMNLVLRIDRSLFSDTDFGSVGIRIFYALITSVIIAIPIKMMITDTQITNHITEQTSLYNQQLEASNFGRIDSVFRTRMDIMNTQLIRGTEKMNIEFMQELRLQKQELQASWEEERQKIKTSISDRYREADYSINGKFIAFLEIQMKSDWMNWLLFLAIFGFESSPCWLRLVYWNCKYLKIVKEKNDQIEAIRLEQNRVMRDMKMDMRIKSIYREYFEKYIEQIKTNYENPKEYLDLKYVIDGYEKEGMEFFRKATQKESNGQKILNKQETSTEAPIFDYA